MATFEGINLELNYSLLIPERLSLVSEYADDCISDSGSINSKKKIYLVDPLRGSVIRRFLMKFATSLNSIKSIRRKPNSTRNTFVKVLVMLVLTIIFCSVGIFLAKTFGLFSTPLSSLPGISFNFVNDLTPDTRTIDWMSKIHDDVLLCQLTIPGTHDSASFATLSGNNMNPLNDYYKCQDTNFRQQLEDGIRYFDFRGYAGTFATGNPRIGFCHGDMLDPRFDYWFDEALDIFANFLRDYPSETIIVIPKRDYRDSTEFQNAWNRAYGINGVLIDDYNSRKTYPWYKSPEHCPRLGNLRGHLVLFSRQSPPIEVPGSSAIIPVWRDNTDNAGEYPFQIQDWYRVVADGNDKSHVIDETMDKALRDSNQNQYWLNFLSCIGNVNGIDGPPLDMARKINHGHMQTLLRRPFGRLGILIMDYYRRGDGVEHNVVAQISSNLRKEGTVIGWYSLHNRARNDKVLDASSHNYDRIYISGSNNDCTTWKITHRDKDGWFSLYNREQKGFLDGGGNLYIRQSYDSDVSDYARWRLVPVPDSLYFLVQNRARFLAGDPNQYLDANSDQPGAYPYLGSFAQSTYSHWRFQRTIWD